MPFLAMMRRRFSQDRLFWSSAATVILLIPLLLAVAWRASVVEHAQQDADQVAITQSWTRRAAIQDLALLLNQAETSQRGYLLSGDPAFITRNRAAAAVIDTELREMEARFVNEPAQARRARLLGDIVRARFARMEEVRQVRDRSGLDAAAALVAEGRGERLMERARTVTEAMWAAEARTLARRLDQAARETALVRFITNASFALVLFAVVAASILAFRYTAIRTRLIRQAQSEIERRQTIFDSAMDCIITFNPSGSIETINRSGEQMFGYGHDELVGRDFSVLAARPIDDNLLFIERMRAARLLQDGQARELEARRRDGTLFPVGLNLGEMAMPDGVHIVAVIRDATERKKAELAKSEFVSTVSHELRTPLTSIAGSLGLLDGGAAGQLPDRAARLVSIAAANSRRLVRLINDILDIEKIESGKLTFNMGPVDLDDMIRRAMDGMTGYAGELGVEIAYQAPEAPVTVRGDADRLMQVLTNLLSNGAKFSPRGGVVSVEVSADADQAHLSVRDQGPGVPPAFRDQIFSRFAQADSSDTRLIGGTGLGLAITKEIVDRHGGRVWFDSPPGEGATFHVELPTARDADAADDHLPRLLLCEDDADAAQILTAALELQGFRVDQVATLADARAALADTLEFEALLLDLHLPDGNGITFLQGLRADPVTRSLPVIVISGESRDAAAAGSLGLIDWIGKPPDMSRLQSALQQVARQGDRPLVMHVDDDPDLRHLVVEAFAGRCRLIAADSLAAARELLSSVTPDLVILDVGLPDGSGLALLPELIDPTGRPLPVVVFSAQGLENPVIAKAVDAVLVKSRTSLGQLIATVRRLSKNRMAESKA